MARRPLDIKALDRKLMPALKPKTLDEGQQQQNDMPQLKPQPADLDSIYQEWRKQQTPENLQRVLQAAKPVIDKSVRAYGGQGSPILEARAKQLAIEAIKRYDPKRNVKLKTHLMSHLRGLYRIAGQQQRIVHVPERMAIDMGRIQRAEQELKDEYGIEPDDRTLADKLGISVKRLQKIRKFMDMPIYEGSLIEEEESEDSSGLPEVEESDTSKREQMVYDYLYHSVGPIDRKILELKLRSKKQFTNADIAKKLKISTREVAERAARLADKYEELLIQEY